MGFNMNEKYDEDNIKKLRYGHLVIMADQDHDGSHIKGLVINMIHSKFDEFRLMRVFCHSRSLT